MNLPEHRKAIDKLDAQIVRLLNERTKHVLAIYREVMSSAHLGPEATFTHQAAIWRFVKNIRADTGRTCVPQCLPLYFLYENLKSRLARWHLTQTPLRFNS